MQAKHGSRVHQTDHTVLFVDRGFPIDVIFYASVWGRRRKEKEKTVRGSGKQLRCSPPSGFCQKLAPKPEITRKVQKVQVAKAEPHTSIEYSPVQMQMGRGQGEKWRGKATNKNLGSLGSAN